MCLFVSFMSSLHLSVSIAGADAGWCPPLWGWCSLLLYALLVNLWTFLILKKKIKSSAMRFHLSTFLFFSSTNWCWLAVRFEKMGLKDLLFYCRFGLCGITGSSGRSLFTEFVYPLFLDKERGKKMEWWAVIYWYCLLNWACFQFIAGNSAERSNSVLAFVKDKSECKSLRAFLMKHGWFRAQPGWWVPLCSYLSFVFCVWVILCSPSVYTKRFW